MTGPWWTRLGDRRSLGPLRRLAPFVLRYRANLVGAMTALVVASTASLAIPLAVRRMIDLGFAHTSTGEIDRYFTALMVVAGVLAVASSSRYYLVSRLGERVVADLRRAVYDHVIALDPAFFEVTRTGEVLSRLTTDTTVVQSAVGSSVSVALRSAVQFTGAFFMLAITSFRLTGLIVVLVPAIVLPIFLLGRVERRLARASQDRIADASAQAGETLAAAATVQAFVQEEGERARFGAAVERAFQTALRRFAIDAVQMSLAIGMGFGAITYVLWRGAHAVTAGALTIGELGQFMLYAAIVASAFGALSEVWGQLQRAAGATERLVELLEAEPAIEAPETPVALPVPAVGSVRFEKVTFAYPSKPDAPALVDFDLEVRPGETVALVGPSGAGKTTVFALLLRFWDPERGRVLLDGADVRDADPRAVRARVGLVPQEPVLFSADAMENIRYGRAGAPDDAVRAAARAAVADGFFAELPQGYGTYLGERGVRLSGGQ
ncbi:MAG: ATP-binding cassette domain-containing protein, partial [Myxococcales bacterium]|nr:ATP-binding cassette domain-containing protein [Myxococcales bacterium]